MESTVCAAGASGRVRSSSAARSLADQREEGASCLWAPSSRRARGSRPQPGGHRCQHPDPPTFVERSRPTTSPVRRRRLRPRPHPQHRRAASGLDPEPLIAEFDRQHARRLRRRRRRSSSRREHRCAPSAAPRTGPRRWLPPWSWSSVVGLFQLFGRRVELREPVTRHRRVRPRPRCQSLAERVVVHHPLAVSERVGARAVRLQQRGGSAPAERGGVTLQVDHPGSKSWLSVATGAAGTVAYEGIWHRATPRPSPTLEDPAHPRQRRGGRPRRERQGHRHARQPGPGRAPVVHTGGSDRRRLITVAAVRPARLRLRSCSASVPSSLGRPGDLGLRAQRGRLRRARRPGSRPDGWLVAEAADADAVLVNTCGFVEAAKKDSDRHPARRR